MSIPSGMTQEGRETMRERYWMKGIYRSVPGIRDVVFGLERNGKRQENAGGSEQQGQRHGETVQCETGKCGVGEI